MPARQPRHSCLKSRARVHRLIPRRSIGPVRCGFPPFSGPAASPHRLCPTGSSSASGIGLCNRAGAGFLHESRIARAPSADNDDAVVKPSPEGVDVWPPFVVGGDAEWHRSRVLTRQSRSMPSFTESRHRALLHRWRSPNMESGRTVSTGESAASICRLGPRRMG